MKSARDILTAVAVPVIYSQLLVSGIEKNTSRVPLVQHCDIWIMVEGS